MPINGGGLQRVTALLTFPLYLMEHTLHMCKARRSKVVQSVHVKNKQPAQARAV